MKNTKKLTVPDLISIGVFTALYFVHGSWSRKQPVLQLW